ncbi:MAG: threonine--tRNA ligase [Candidatus Gracilibacteria bacterium]
MDKQAKLERIRHSLSHLMSMAIMEKKYPQAGLGVGPSIENGFYQDYDLPESLSETDFGWIEKKMRGMIHKKIDFKQSDSDFASALKFYKHDPYKTEMIKDLKAKGEKKLSFYDSDGFHNLCAGPHVENTSEINPEAFKIMSVAGAYWRGDEKNKMLTRLYGVAFETKEELDDYLAQLEEAKKRDHRKLGMELDLFQFHEISPGAAFYHPKGAIIFNELTAFLRREYRKRGYSEVVTPLVYDKSLWEQSGHWEHYRENMFLMEVDGKEASLKPMNCPSHMLMFKMRTRSYRDLPLRIADFAMLHRNELRGALGGMTRVRKFCMDDAHIFVGLDQLDEEIMRCIDFTQYVYKLFGFDFHVMLSTRPEKSMGSEEQWNTAEKALEKALKAAKIPYEINAGDGAFYGPKIDFRIHDCLKREWQCATIQVDFQMPLRFELKYEAQDGKLHTPIVLHRALLGSLERFLAILTEHYAGAFPFWLAPVQMRLLPLGENFNDYAVEVKNKLFEAGYRVEVDDSNQTLGKKIREAETLKIPVMGIIGEKEAAAHSITLRYYGQRQQDVLSVEQVIEKYKDAVPK